VSLKALGYRMLIEVEEVPETTAGGIILAQQTKDADEAAQEFGRVVDIGEFAFKEYPAKWCKVGDMVSFQKYVGKVIVDPETKKKFRVINDIDVHCVVSPGRVVCAPPVEEWPPNSKCSVFNSGAANAALYGESRGTGGVL